MKTFFRKTIISDVQIGNALDKVENAFTEGDIPKAAKLYDEYEELVLSREKQDVKPRNAFFVWREQDAYEKCVGRGI